MKSKFTKGKANRDTLDDRMKRYEDVTTSRALIERLPTYARIDGRSFHTFCRVLDKPFDSVFAEVMQKTVSYLVDKTNASVGYWQSDEISLAWQDPSKCPFETRLFKLESVIASMATSAFIIYGLETKLNDRILAFMPNFDCRVCQLPNMTELTNMFMFRENDCVKNAITLVALSKFSHKSLQNVGGAEKIRRLKEEANIDFENDVDEIYRRGAYFRRENYLKELSVDEIERIPVNRRKFDDDGKMRVIRSHVVRFSLGARLVDIENRPGVLFNKEIPKFKAK